MDSKTITTDVCIIGAGPAGVTASLTLAKHHIPHLLVDSSVFPRHKPCADIIPAGALRTLNEIDPEIIAALKMKNGINPIWKNVIYPPNGKEINIEFLPLNNSAGEPSCYAISRFEFDNILFSKAKENEFVTTMEGCHIASLAHHKDYIRLSTRNGKTIIAKLVIIATGSNSNILKFLGNEFPDEHCSVGIRAYYKNISCENECAELILESSIMPGGLYITPLPENKFNVNMVLFLENVDNRQMNLREIFESTIDKNPLARERFANAKRISKFQGSKLNMGVKKRVISGDRFLVIGDSAGLIDIITANGIPQAMISGQFAALRVVEAFKEGDFTKEFLQAYEIALYNKISNNLLLGKVLYPFLRINLFCRFALRLLNYISKRPQTNALIRDLLNHKNSKVRLLDPRFYFDLLLK